MRPRRVLKSPWLPAFLFVGAVLSAVAHNLLCAVFKFEEPVFFALTFVLLLGAAVSLIVVAGRTIARLLFRR